MIRDGTHDCRQRTFQIVRDVVMPEPRCREFLLARPVVPLFVMQCIVVLPFVCFYDRRAPKWTKSTT